MSRRIAVALLLIGSRLAAQSVPPADSNDVKSPDAIIRALYESNIMMVDRKQGEARFRSIASPDARFTVYETFRDSSDTHPLYGINSIQLAYDGRRWWVMNVLWDNASPAKPIPAKYRP